jgi:hypothetical protein
VDINWLQVIIAYVIGGLTFAMLRAWVTGLKAKVT